MVEKLLNGHRLSREETSSLYLDAPLGELMALGYEVRRRRHPDNVVTWMIDRNMNITNVCVSACKFCNYYRGRKHPDAYITSLEEYREKIAETFSFGGEQLLLQGGMHPELGLKFYTELFSSLKKIEPRLKLHTLGPPEVVHLAKMEGLSYHAVLTELRHAGMDSLPGAGAEILVDRVRKLVSPAKCTAVEWLEVMREAHSMDILTSATMMFGHVETPQERIEHLFRIRELQDEKPQGATGFMSFIPWPFQDEGTTLARLFNIRNSVKAADYIRLIALARLVLDNVAHIQASWLTVGKEVAQLCLYAGADDLGSIMIEENVVSQAGARFRMSAGEMQQTILEAGFQPVLRDQGFQVRDVVPFG
ncbi:MAG TPA: cyclic dehypoxanthinyl futalosine synthase [Bacteroidales bacterium]|nr:cyclic dehypoxanthinyl futalosine synthase [Bacteroidales bacterium]